MQVETMNAVATVVRDGRRLYFCSDRCAEKFLSQPSRSATPKADAQRDEHQMSER
jgi:YHS domain-containing protein